MISTAAQQFFEVVYGKQQQASAPYVAKVVKIGRGLATLNNGLRVVASKEWKVGQEIVVISTPGRNPVGIGR